MMTETAAPDAGSGGIWLLLSMIGSVSCFLNSTPIVVLGAPVINEQGVLGQVTRVYPLSAEVSPDNRYLLVHCFSLDDEAGTNAQIKQRYEAPLKEIFE